MELIDEVEFDEILEAVLAEKEMYNFDNGNSNTILLVEGIDDIHVINSYYYYKNKDEMPFRVVRAEELNEKVSGKKNALKAFENYKDEFSNLVCLLDRDFDFFLGESINNERIFYYDYYELENYLFDETVLKLLAARYFNCRNNITFGKVLSELMDNAIIFLPYMKLGLFREVCYRNPLIDKEKIEKVVEIASTNPVKILERKKEEFSNLNPIEKIKKFITDELGKVNISLEEIERLVTQEEITSTSDVLKDLEFFKYGIGTKLILGALQLLMKENFITVQFNKAGNVLSLEKSLKDEWIPHISQDFERLMNLIEAKSK